MRLSRRDFLTLLSAAGSGLLTSKFLPRVASTSDVALPPPVSTGTSVETCLNSRLSYHGGWSGEAPLEYLSTVVWAAGRAPLTGRWRKIYVATKENVYLYNPETHSLSIHKSGDFRADKKTAFQIGWSSEDKFDAGLSLIYSQLQGVALWNGTTAQLASCPRNGDRDYANKNWGADSYISIVISFGIRDVRGHINELVAKSSDGSLSDPLTSGSNGIESQLEDLFYISGFNKAELSSSEISQLLWSGYGCTPHKVDRNYGLTVPSAWAKWYLTGKIYLINSGGVFRYHNRKTGSMESDHRLERLDTKDVRGVLRRSVLDLPFAPCYVILCLASSDFERTEPRLEVGFAAGAMLLQATSLGIGCYFNSNLSDAERSNVKKIASINDEPMAIISIGRGSIEAVDWAIKEFRGGKASRDYVDRIIRRYMEGRLKP